MATYQDVVSYRFNPVSIDSVQMHAHSTPVSRPSEYFATYAEYQEILLCKDIKRLDELIDTIEKSGRTCPALKKQRNFLSPTISRLPVDIYLVIFILIASGTKPTGEEWYDWLKLTKVCTAWRDMALKCPALWVNIHNFSLPDKVYAFLQRSGEATLSVHLNVAGSTRNAYKCFKILESEMWRVKELKVSFDREGYDLGWKSLMYCLDELTERNKVLSITCESADTDVPVNVADDMGVDMDIDAELDMGFGIGFGAGDHIAHGFDGIGRRTADDPQAPLLELSHIRPDRLMLNGTHTSWTSSVFSGLTELCIRDLCLDFQPFMNEVVHILERCPNLQALTFDKAGPRISKDSYEIEAVCIPTLRSVGLHGISGSVSSQFFKCISSSNEAVYQISYVADGYTINVLETGFLAHFSGKEKTDCINIQLSSKQIVIEAGLESSTATSSIGLPIPSNFVEELQTDLLRNSLKVIFEHSNLRAASRTVIYYQEMLNSWLEESGMWSIIFETLPETTMDMNILLPPSKINDASNVVTGSLNAGMTNDSMRCLPNLHKLSISHADFSTRAGERAYERLKDMMMKREMLSGFERKLCLRSCKLKRNDYDSDLSDSCEIAED